MTALREQFCSNISHFGLQLIQLINSKNEYKLNRFLLKSLQGLENFARVSTDFSVSQYLTLSDFI